MAVAIAVLNGSCAKKDSTSEAKADSSAPVAASSTAAVNSTAAQPTTNWVRTKQFPRQSETGATITVTVDVSDQAYIVDRTTPPPTDRLIARFRNIGDHGMMKGKEKLYGFESSDRVSEYRLYIRPRKDPATGTTAWEMMRVGGDGKESHHRGGGLKLCEAFHPAGYADVGFKHCPGALPQPKAKKASMFGTGVLEAMYSRIFGMLQPDTIIRLIDPAWVSCGDGCCSVST